LKRRYALQITGVALLTALLCVGLNAATWLPFGPDGGDARAFAADPHDHSHLYLGTLTGWIYESHDDGVSWKRLSWIGKRNNLALDSIVVDAANPKHILVGAWVLGNSDGGLYISNDGGLSWESEADMRGQSIRALAAAPSNPKVLVAGTLKGVYRSVDGGEHWQLISPEGSQEIHEVESIAIDPTNPEIIYAGTWHLPWKTTDGGASWASIKQGIIEDSDVFSIILDPKHPNVVYASACSGIYKSEDGGTKFTGGVGVNKTQGIPSSARRTRVLMQDPQNLNIVFAGTTEGLFRTGDSGANWLRTTGPEVIVNDVYVDPANTNRILLATDRGGVLASNDGGYSFVPSNAGFSARQITSYIGDAVQPATIYVGVVNDKAWGGVFVSDNGGLSWAQKSAGLNGQDVFSLGQASDGTVLAGTGHGIYRLQGELWSRVNNVVLSQSTEPAVEKAIGSPKSSAKVRVTSAKKTREPAPVRSFDANVNAIARAGDTLYAATSEGMLRSVTAGESWKLVTGLERQNWNFVSTAKSWVAAATLNSAMLSSDGGQRWAPVKLPESLEQLAAVAVDDSGGLWVGGREGIFVSEDRGASWQSLKNLSIRDVNSLFYDEPSQRMLISANSQNTIAFSVHLPDRAVHYWNSGWNLRLVRPVGDHLVGATLFDGIVVQPRMVDSSEVSSQPRAIAGR
jgi:photosystem II stability/assembly factor-like uncharacterized protein